MNAYASVVAGVVQKPVGGVVTVGNVVGFLPFRKHYGTYIFVRSFAHRRASYVLKHEDVTLAGIVCQAWGEEILHFFSVGMAAIGCALHQYGAAVVAVGGFVNGGVEVRSVAHGYHYLTFCVVVAGVLGHGCACSNYRKKGKKPDSF